MEQRRRIIKKRPLTAKQFLKSPPSMENQSSPEDPPKKRPYFLPVIPSVEPEGLRPDSYVVLAPPPLPMPYGLGTTLENGEEFFGKPRGRVIEAWANEFNGKPVNLNGSVSFTFTRKNEHYAERPFSGEMFGELYFTLLISFLFYPIPYFVRPPTEPFFEYSWFYVFFLLQIFFLLIVSFSIFYKYQNLPTIIFNRLRDEIYIYSGEKKALFIKKYSTATFLLYSTYFAGLYLLLEDEKDLHDEKNRWIIAGGRGFLDCVIPSWEYIRRYMAAGEGYKDLPLRKSLLYLIPFQRLADRLDGKIFSPPHRWPPEIERLLWPENKNAPLPAGWQYDTWIPYEIPQGGFDNSELLRKREEQLRDSDAL